MAKKINKKPYNPFKMWGGYLGALLGLFYILQLNKDYFPFIETIAYLLLGFLFGWAIHSLMKKFGSKMNPHKFLILNKKKSIWVIIAWIVSVLLHNFISALTGFEEAFFFIIAVIVIPLFFIISVIYTIIKLIKNKKENKKIKNAEDNNKH